MSNGSNAAPASSIGPRYRPRPMPGRSGQAPSSRPARPLATAGGEKEILCASADSTASLLSERH